MNKSENTDHGDHFCPGCGQAQRVFQRYPWYFCQDCLKTACDRSGQRIHFGNSGLMGGMDYWFDDEAERTSAGRVICLISGRPVLVTEARFGGIVAQPLTSHPVIDRAIDLRQGPPPPK